MKWFWYSLIGFCVLMCSCKTQKSASDINVVNKENIQTELSKFEILVDTTKTFRIGIDKSKLKIIETIKITEYDAESGKPIKETDAKREITQDSDQAIAESEQERTELSLVDSLKHFRESTEKVESEVKEESEDASVVFWREIGRWIGIVIAFILAFKIFWPPLKKKF